MTFIPLTLNHRAYTENQLRALCMEGKEVPETDQWERDLFSFVLAWISPEPDIEVRTSGSTGKARSWMVRKEQMIRSAQMTARVLGLAVGDSALLCLPTQYIAGKMMVVRAFVCGLDLIAEEPTSSPLAGIPGTIDFAAVTPMQLQEAVDSRAVERIRTLLVGGGSVSASLSAAVQSLRTQVIETYGMTETLTHVAFRPLSGAARSPFFTALEDASFSCGDRGCLVVHAPWISDEPVYTNDLVRLCDPFTFELLGRANHVINTGGIKVVPETVEHKLGPLLPNRRFFVAGSAHPTLGQEVVLVIEGAPCKIDADAFEAVLDRFEAPRKTLFTKRFLVAESGKVNRAATLDAMGPKALRKI
ncbi:MAG: AMP-binding protein [Candidatus Latescibacterota bacterium]